MKNKGTVFIEHIKSHLYYGDKVYCKICHMTVEEIWEKYKKEKEASK